MPELVIFLLKVNLVLLLFAAAYFFFLRKLTFYNLNRYFLLTGILVSSLYSLFDSATWLKENATSTLPFMQYLPQVNVNDIVAKPSLWENWNLWLYLFYTGLAYFAIRFLIQLISLYNIHRQTQNGLVHGESVRIFKKNISPFSFGRYVYINPSLHNDEELLSILAHEKIHVKEWHTVDILIAEIASILYWFNPGIWLMKRAVKENLEFIADEKMILKGLNKKQYQYSLLAVGQLKPELSMVNHFNLSDLKLRIRMMNAQRTAPVKRVLYLFILPLICVLTLVFSFQNSNAVEVIGKTIPKNVQAAVNLVENTISEPSNHNEPKLSSNHNEPKITSSRLKSKEAHVYVTEIDTPSNLNTTKIKTVIGFRTQVSKGASEGIVVSKGNGASERNSANIGVGHVEGKGASEGLGNVEGKSVGLDIEAKTVNKASIVVVRGFRSTVTKESNNAKVPKAVGVINLKVDIPLDSVSSTKPNWKIMGLGSNATQKANHVRFLLDGKEVSELQVSVLNPNDIESINVIKKSATSSTAKDEIHIITKPN